MRRVRRQLAVLGICLGLTLGAGMVVQVTGCATSAKSKAYNSIYSVEVATSAAFVAYLSEVAKGAAATNNVPSVALAYNLFQEGVKASILFLGDTNAPAPPNLVRASSDVLVSISKAKGLK